MAKGREGDPGEGSAHSRPKVSARVEKDTDPKAKAEETEMRRDDGRK